MVIQSNQGFMRKFKAIKTLYVGLDVRYVIYEDNKESEVMDLLIPFPGLMADLPLKDVIGSALTKEGMVDKDEQFELEIL